MLPINVNAPTCFSEKNRHPQGDITTNEHTISIHHFYEHNVKNIQNIPYKYNGMEINMVISYFMFLALVYVF
jgi:hypothetical protein